MTHNYTQQIKKVARQKQGRDKTLMSSGLSMMSNVRPYTDDVERKPYKPTEGVSSVHSGTFYKDKNSKQGGFLPNGQLSGQNQGNPPSSLWRQHPIAPLL